ncbi:envelope glycoprotein 24 [macacine betaherpesvirus 9]|uniref:Envelope glycoprotein 24 n=1 Tax=macacine betaherpesvirus 9 TaxID=2560568 RepID=A0A191S3W7_9BETA|nr:envelope glycoprotein 24 [macacine betaherpesvirus 9]ANC96595.1 envelope glycoprotein 24 [macacine betaherpesvirus 9]
MTTKKCFLCWTVFINSLVILMICLLIFRCLIGFNNDLWTQFQNSFGSFNTTFLKSN